MAKFTIENAIKSLGFEFGWAANEANGILYWERDEPQPTEAELIAAGWIKPEPAEEAPEE
jgi:hypothetical protein